ncbi:hypothetical protein BAE44_0013008, partial [Dichanthelium oligosanthes]
LDMEDAPEKRVADLPDDLLVEILSRLPAKTLCRFKCVSKSWRALMSDPAHRHMFAHAMPCFFFCRYYDNDTIPFPLAPPWGFVTAEGDGGLPLVDSTLSFLPASARGGDIELRLLQRASPPALLTGQRKSLKSSSQSLITTIDDFYAKACSAALGSDPSVSPHFHVFQLEEKQHSYDHFVNAVEIYSSETGTWVGWSPQNRRLYMTGHMTYFSGFLHLTMWYGVIAMVDAKGQSWRTIGVPLNGSRGKGFVGHSQGRLTYVDVRTRPKCSLVIYALEDYNGEWWTLKHKVSIAALFGREKLPNDPDNPVAAFHPDCDRLFFYDRLSGKRLMSYDMNQRRVQVICDPSDVSDEIRPFFLVCPVVLLDLRPRDV